MVTESRNRINLPAATVIVWLATLVGLAGSTMLAMAHIVFGPSPLIIASLWTVRCLTLAAMWLLPASRTQKIAGTGLILLSLLLDIALKAPVLGTVEYGDWFVAAALDLSGLYGGYFTTWGLLLPLLSLTGWFIVRGRSLAGWLTGLASGLGMGFVALALTASAGMSLSTFTLITMARYILPALLAGLADALVRRRSAVQE